MKSYEFLVSMSKQHLKNCNKHKGWYLTYLKEFMCVCAKLLQLCLTLWPMGCSPPGPSVHGIHQARIWEWNARLSCRASSWRQERSRGIKPVTRLFAVKFFTIRATSEAQSTHICYCKNKQKLKRGKSVNNIQTFQRTHSWVINIPINCKLNHQISDLKTIF